MSVASIFFIPTFCSNIFISTFCNPTFCEEKEKKAEKWAFLGQLLLNYYAHYPVLCEMWISLSQSKCFIFSTYKLSLDQFPKFKDQNYLKGGESGILCKWVNCLGAVQKSADRFQPSLPTFIILFPYTTPPTQRW